MLETFSTKKSFILLNYQRSCFSLIKIYNSSNRFIVHRHCFCCFFVNFPKRKTLSNKIQQQVTSPSLLNSFRLDPELTVHWELWPTCRCLSVTLWIWPWYHSRARSTTSRPASSESFSCSSSFICFNCENWKLKMEGWKGGTGKRKLKNIYLSCF